MSNDQASCLCLIHYPLDHKFSVASVLPLGKPLVILRHIAANVLSFGKPSQTPIGGMIYSLPRVPAASF